MKYLELFFSPSHNVTVIFPIFISPWIMTKLGWESRSWNISMLYRNISGDLFIFFHGLNKATNICRVTLPNRDLKTRWTESPQQKVKKDNNKAGRRRRDGLCKEKKKHSNFSKPQTGEITKVYVFPLGAEDSSSTSGTQTPRSCTRERSPQQLALKTNEEYAQENYRTAENGEPALKGLEHSLTPHKNTRLKSTWNEVWRESTH